MRAKGYSTYRGRSPLKSFLKAILVIIVILFAAGLAAIIYLQQFLVFSEDGVYVDLPDFLRGGETDSTPTPDPSLPALPSPLPAPSSLPVEVVTPPPVPEPEGLLPVALSAEALYDGTAKSQVEAAGGDAALFDMKADTGMLGYVSGLELAAAAGVSSEDHSINVAIRALNQEEGLYTIARVSCFKDHTAPAVRDGLAITTNSGYRWSDPEGVRWLSPTSAEVQAYLTGICLELAQLGFDEILLDNAGYPDRGNLNYIKRGAAYDPEQFSAVIAGFYGQISAALEGYDVKLSVITTPEALAGQDSLTGQTPDSLSLPARLWIRDEWGGLYLADQTQGGSLNIAAE